MGGNKVGELVQRGVKEGKREKKSSGNLAENLLFQEMNGEKFLLRLYITDERAGIVSDNQSTLQMISVTADGHNKNVIYELHPRSHRKIHNDKFVSQTYSSVFFLLSRLISFRSALSFAFSFFAGFLFGTSSKSDE
jgi:hypothetical protein